jgi:hypothetical protein
LPQWGRVSKAASRLLDGLDDRRDGGFVLDPGEVQAEGDPLVARAQPEVVRGGGADLADLQDCGDGFGDVLERSERGYGVLSREEGH